jgi:hypothetical protein
MFPTRTRWRQSSRRAMSSFLKSLKDTENGLRGFELKDADGYFPFDVQTVLGLRVLHNLPLPQIDHPLLETKLGRLPPEQPFPDESC